MMKLQVPVIALLIFAHAEASADPVFPLAPGEYDFRLIDAEYTDEVSTPARVSIKGTHITVVVSADGGPFHRDQVFADGTLRWHANSGQWIIVENPEDLEAGEVGGCSGGPWSIDLERRAIWYC